MEELLTHGIVSVCTKDEDKNYVLLVHVFLGASLASSEKNQ
jgi:hypothetical protein